MTRKTLSVLYVTAILGSAGVGASAAQWPQWRGPSRDGVAAAAAPTTWPAALTKKWQVAVGSGY